MTGFQASLLLASIIIIVYIGIFIKILYFMLADRVDEINRENRYYEDLKTSGKE